MKVLAGLAAAAVVFAVLATANSGGYRYGVSDQAFYQPAVVKHLHPELFPRDTPLIESQAKLMWSDELVAGLARTVQIDLPPLYLAFYLVTLAALFGAGVAFARASGLSWWACAVFLLLLTLRHRIAKTGANSLEGYMHPRELAFACGVAIFACILQGRYAWAVVLAAAAGILHPTTLFWFAIALAIAVAFSQPSWRRALVGVAVLGIALGLWALLGGPLSGRLVRMDTAWLAVLADKDYLFPTAWPAYAWIANLAYPVVIALICRRRSALGVLAPGERGLLAGLAGLLAVFLVSVPLTAMHIALAVQMQVTRVFWLFDVVTALYLAWWIADSPRPAGWPAARWRPAIAIAVLAAVSAGRGIYLLESTQPARALVDVALPRTPWIEAMAWLKTQPTTWLVLADPGHAWKYGVSVRLAAERDTVLESGKDTAIAMYDRQVAMRVADRSAALNGFDDLTTAGARALGTRYGADVVIVERSRPLDLPELHRNAQFVIYDLR